MKLETMKLISHSSVLLLYIIKLNTVNNLLRKRFDELIGLIGYRCLFLGMK